MSDLTNFVTSNWEGIVAVLTAAVVFAGKIAKLTSTTKDDEFIARVETALSVIGKK